MPEEVAHRGDLDERTRLLGIPADADLDDIEGDAAQLPVDSFSDVDPWAWVEQDSEKSEHVDTSGCSVTAVLVARDAAGWLPETLTGLSRLRRRPTRLIALDAGSSDATLQQLERGAHNRAAGRGLHRPRRLRVRRRHRFSPSPGSA